MKYWEKNMCIAFFKYIVHMHVHCIYNADMCMSNDLEKNVHESPWLCCRLLEVISYKIYSIQREETLLDLLSSQGSTKSYRIEEIPLDEVNLSSNETLIPVAHFQKVTHFYVPEGKYWQSFKALNTDFKLWNYFL